jgi:hypothetical protein
MSLFSTARARETEPGFLGIDIVFFLGLRCFFSCLIASTFIFIVLFKGMREIGIRVIQVFFEMIIKIGIIIVCEIGIHTSAI